MDLSAFTVTLPLPLAEAEKRTRETLATEQFGIISDIDLQAKLKEKLGIEYPPHKILGACNPTLSYRALQDNVDVALALPCNVVLREENGSTVITAMPPSVALQPFEGDNVRKTEAAAEDAMKRVFRMLRS
jgi:uncharacterized protein (DUF302 family)